MCKILVKQPECALLMSRQGTAGVDYAPVRAFYQLLECHDANTRTLQDVHLTSDCDLCRTMQFQTLTLVPERMTTFFRD